jgi:hypothetical protein
MQPRIWLAAHLASHPRPRPELGPHAGAHRRVLAAAAVNPVHGDTALGIGRAVTKLWEDLVSNPKENKQQQKAQAKADEAKQAAEQAAVYASEAEEDAAMAMDAGGGAIRPGVRGAPRGCGSSTQDAACQA